MAAKNTKKENSVRIETVEKIVHLGRDDLH
jgi:hypothetical protein